MKITILGAGNMGSALATQLARAGHQVRITSRDPAKARAVADAVSGSTVVAAKQTAKALIESIGFKAVDAGGLKNARYLEPLAGLNIYFGYGAGQGTGIAPTWMKAA